MESTDPQQTIRNAIIDAQLVVDYSARAGLLREGDPLVRELHNVNEQLEQGRTPYTGDLLHALSDSLNVISDYTSLVELREGYSPFSWCYKILHPDARQRTIVERFVAIRVNLSIALPFIFLLVASISSFLLIDRYRDELELLKMVEYVERVEPNALIARIVRQVKEDDGSARSLQDLQASMESLKSSIKSANAFSHYSYEQKSGGVWAGIKRFLAERFSAPASASASNMAGQSMSGAEAFNPVAHAKLCDALRRQVNESSGPVRAARDKAYTECIEQALSLDEARVLFADAARRTAALRNDAYRMVAWYIPLSVGFLGAAIYLLYIRNYRRPFFSFQRTLLRFALGGVAGVLIAWVYPPARISATDLDVMDSVRQFPFMFAFLAGFGADSIFTLMSRKVEAFGSGTTESKQAPTGGEAGQPKG